MLGYLLSKFITIFFGMMYPAYASYKTIRAKDAKGYVHWMMHWIVFAVYSFAEIFSDALFSAWFPFYYELKIMFVFWMLSPTTRGGNTLYRSFIHPTLTNNENEIDAFLVEAKLWTGNIVTEWCSRAFGYIYESFVRIFMRPPGLAVNRSPNIFMRREPLIELDTQEYNGNKNMRDEDETDIDIDSSVLVKSESTRRSFVETFESEDSDYNQTLIPPPGLRKEAKLAKKMKNVRNVNITSQSLRRRSRQPTPRDS